MVQFTFVSSQLNLCSSFFDVVLSKWHVLVYIYITKIGQDMKFQKVFFLHLDFVPVLIAQSL